MFVCSQITPAKQRVSFAMGWAGRIPSVSKETAQRMAGALMQLASDDGLNKTCCAIPGNREGKQDLLVAYLEDEPNARDPYAELFGNEAATYDAPDFAAAARPVLAALEGKVTGQPKPTHPHHCNRRTR